VNLHASLLPRWRGASPIQSAILAGDAESGVTSMQMVEALDAGDMLLKAQTPISPDDTAASLHDRLSALAATLVLPTLKGLETRTLSGTAQDETQVCFALKLNKEQGHLNPWADSAEVLDRKIRAFTPWPGSSIQIQGTRLKIIQASPRTNIQGPAGQLFERSGMLLLGTSLGSLELRQLQWEGKKASTIQDFKNGLQGRKLNLPFQIDPSQ
jgi:methionyl-tRNA formyltransferase